jgi:hypothetical protein
VAVWQVPDADVPAPPADAHRHSHAPLCASTARLWWLRALCAVAEGADVPLSHAVLDVGSSAPSRCPPGVCVAAVLGDALHRVAVLGGREGMPRSLGSVYGGSVTRFLGGGLRGVESRVICVPGTASRYVGGGGIAVMRDGQSVLLSRPYGDGHNVLQVALASRTAPRIVGCRRPTKVTGAAS